MARILFDEFKNVRMINITAPIRRLFIFQLSLVFLCSVCISPHAQAILEDPFSIWLQDVRQEAKTRGISDKVIGEALANIKPMRRIIDRDRNQAEFKLTLSTYSKRVISQKNIKIGKNKAKLLADTLEAVEKRFKVQRRFILSIWGIETRFGLVQANVPVIPAVATLAFDKRRSKYFRAQVFSVLEMLEKGYIDLENLKGSWAGAMGQPQFMPSSYLAYAADFDGDGRRDIWNNTGDVLASIANYLSKHGWNNTMTWGRAVSVPSSTPDWDSQLSRRAAPGCRARTSKILPLPEWQALGVRKVNGTDLPPRNIAGALVFPDGANGSAFITYNNYSAIMAYNCAHHYAITVGLLSDKIQGIN